MSQAGPLAGEQIREAPPPECRRPGAKHRPYKPRTKPNPLLAIPPASTRDGKRLRTLKAELEAHVGGAPNAPQTVLITRIVQLQWQSMKLDRATAKASAGEVAQIATASVVLLNALGRALTRLGLHSPAAEAPDLRAYLAERYGTPGAA